MTTAATLAGPLRSARQVGRRPTVTIARCRVITLQSLPRSSHSIIHIHTAFLDEWEQAGKAANAGSISSAGFDVWGDSIVIDLEEGGGNGTGTLIHQRRA